MENNTSSITKELVEKNINNKNNKRKTKEKLEEFKKEKQKIEEESETIKKVIESFSVYTKTIFVILFSYIVCFLLWIAVSEFLSSKFNMLEKRKENSWNFFLTFFAMCFNGLIFSLDGFVSGKIKAPFGQFCFFVNSSKTLTKKEREEIVNDSNNANEHFRETLKKFGFISILSSFLSLYRDNYTALQCARKEYSGVSSFDAKNRFFWLFYFSYLFPIFFGIINILKINSNLKNIDEKIKNKKKEFDFEK